MKRDILGAIIPNVVFATNNIVVQLLRDAEKYEEGDEVAEQKKVVIIGADSVLRIVRIDEQYVVANHDDKMPYDLAEYIPKGMTVYLVHLSDTADGDSVTADVKRFVEKFWRGVPIDMIGFGRIGTCFFKATTLLGEKRNLKLFTIATPFRGNVLYGKNDSSKGVFKRVFDYFVKKYIVSDIQIENDLVENSEFVKSLEDLRCPYEHVNIVTLLQNTNYCKSFGDYVMFWMDRRTNMIGDGAVSYASQHLLGAKEEVVNFPNTSALRLSLQFMKAKKYF